MSATIYYFIVCQLQKKYQLVDRQLYMAFMDLEKTFENISQKIIWQALRNICVDEWIVQQVRGMYADVQSHIRVGGGHSQESEVKVGVHQGFIFSSLFYIVVLVAL